MLGGKGKQNKFLESLRAEGEAWSWRASAINGPNGRGGRARGAQDGVSLRWRRRSTCTLKKDGGIEGMELQGTMMLEINGGEEDAFIRVGVAPGANEGSSSRPTPTSTSSCTPSRACWA